MPIGIYKRKEEHTEKLMKTLKPYCFGKGHIPWNKGKKGIMPTPWNKGLSVDNSEKVRVATKGIVGYAQSDEGRAKARESLSKTSINFWAGMSIAERQAFIDARALRIKASRGLPEAVAKQRLSMVLKHRACPEWGQKTSQILRQKHKDPEYRQRNIARLHRGRDKSWADPERKAERIRAMLSASWRRPTCPEKKVIDTIDEFKLPYKYVGDGAFILGGKNPDFMNINGEKKLVEVFGEYWHDRNSTEAEDRQKAFAQYGFHTLILWETDLKRMSHKEIAGAIRGFK